MLEEIANIINSWERYIEALPTTAAEVLRQPERATSEDGVMKNMIRLSQPRKNFIECQSGVTQEQTQIPSFKAISAEAKTTCKRGSPKPRNIEI